MFDVGVVHSHLRTHFGQLADHHFAPAVPRVTHVLAVARAADEDTRPRDIASHVAERVPRKLGHVKTASVVDVDRRRRDLEHVVAIVEAKDVSVRQ